MKFKIWKLILLLFLVFIIAILAFAPTIAKNQIEKNSKEWVGRQLRIESIRLNYFTGTLRITDFTMFEADDKTEFVGFDSLIIDTEPYRYFKNELVVESFSLIGLRTYVIQEDSIFNFSDLITYHSGDTDTTLENEVEPEDTINNDPMVIILSNILINANIVSYRDLVLDHETKMEGLNFVLPYLSWNAEGGSQAGIHFDLNEGGSFAANLDFNPDSNEYHADLKISNLDLSSYYVYAEQQLNISSLQGFLSTHFIIDGDVDELEKSLLTGSVNLDDFQVDNLDNAKLLGLKKLEIRLGEIDYFNNNYVVDSILLDQPYVDFELLKEGSNFDQLLKASSSEEVQKGDPSMDTAVQDVAPLYYAIHKFSIRDGVVDFHDHTTPEPFSYNLSSINMSAKEITSNADWVITYLDMLLNKRGIMKVELGFNPNKPLDLDLDYVLTNFQLSDVNIYSKMHTGYPFLYGEMFYYSDTKIRDGIIESKNKLKINDVELGDKVKGWKSIPIKFAMFILKDKNGDIELDVPVNGDLNDPDIDIKKLVWTTFKKLIIKIASSPVDFFSGIADVDPNDIKTIEFAYGDTSLSNKVENQLNMLVKLENSKPGLMIQMVYFNDISKEKEAIAVREIGNLFYMDTHNHYEKDEDKFAAYIKSKTLKDSVDVNIDCVSMVGDYKLDSIYRYYNDRRFYNLNAYLHAKSDSTLIKVTPYKSDAPKNIGSNPIFEMKYSIDE